MNKSYLLLILASLLLANCAKKSVPQITTSPTVITPAGLTVNNIDFLYFTSKSGFRFKDDSENQEAIATLRMRKDSIIWINISAGLGIEAMRAIITPDSIVVVDKIKKQYVVYSFANLSKRYNFDIDFNLLQNLLLGNLLKEKGTDDQITKEATYSVLTQKQNNSLIESFLNEKLGKVQKLQISENGTSNLLSVDYGNFKEIDGRNIPNSVSIDLDYTYLAKKYKVNIDIDHQKAEFAEKGVKFPFNIPAKYEKVD